MAYYTMFYNKMNDILEFYQREKNKSISSRNLFDEVKSIELKPIKFISNGKLLEKFNLEDFDAMTCGYECEEAFLEELRTCSLYRNIIDNSKETLIIIHKSKGVPIESPVVYNNLFLKRQASFVRNKRKLGLKETLLDDSSELQEFISKIKSYALNNDAYRYMINSPDIDYMMSKYLSEFVKLSNKDFKTFDEEADLDDISNQITYRMRKYSVLRKMVVWEQKYLRSKKYHRDVERLKYKINKEFDNPELTRWYNDGGTSAILENMGADEIYNSNPYDLIDAGILPQDYDPLDENNILVRGRNK